MDNLVYIIFICHVTPLALMTLMLRKRSRLLVGYMLIGIFVSLFVSELNTILLGLCERRYTVRYNNDHTDQRRDRKGAPRTVLCRCFL